MNENINLSEILKGHEGETFYSESLGSVKLHKLESTSVILTVNKHKSIAFKCAIIDAEDDLFPSKDQRDWLKWDKENNKRTPKIWSELVKNRVDKLGVTCDYGNVDCSFTEKDTPIEKSALALLKIHQLIEIGYGGNVTEEEWKDDNWKYSITCDGKNKCFEVIRVCWQKYIISFHTKEQTEEFLSYPENVQLLRDYFQIN